MPTLTEKQKKFAAAYVLSGSARGAALEAGYADSVADNAYREVLGSDAVKETISKLQEEAKEETIKALAASSRRAVAVLVEIVENEKAPASARVRACVELLDRAGFAVADAEARKPPKPGEDSLDGLLSGEDDDEPHGTACPE